MIFKCELILSVKNEPSNITQDELLRDRIQEQLKKLEIVNKVGPIDFKMTVEDVGVFNLKTHLDTK